MSLVYCLIQLLLWLLAVVFSILATYLFTTEYEEVVAAIKAAYPHTIDIDYTIIPGGNLNSRNGCLLRWQFFR